MTRATPRKPADTDRGHRFAFCEPVTATLSSFEHIRRVGPDGLHPGGGIPVGEYGTALCGYVVARGWDLASPVTEQRLAVDTEVNPTCRRCAAAWRAETGGAPSRS